ncbi:MAG: PIG-L family deacetylase [Armatimonadota bacterium]|nr:PIG-L family deacetylase [Armatimonadota bacterium]
MRILAVGAHPDDIEILCAGTLAKYASQGHDIIMCHACIGDKGHFHIPNDELAKIRRKEAQLSASRIGAESISLGIPDCEIFNNRETLAVFIDMIRVTKPDLIITHSPTDYMPDHCVVSGLVYDASFHASLPNWKTEHEYHDKVPPVIYMDNVAGVDFEPGEYVDITDFIEKKKEMMMCHQSQVVWLKEHDNLDVIQFIEDCAKFRGWQCGVKYAEAFRTVNRWPRLRTQRLLP